MATNSVSINKQILANGLCLLCCYKWDSDPEAAFAEEDNGGGIVEEDEGIAISSESSGRSDEPIIALRNVEPLQVRTSQLSSEGEVMNCTTLIKILHPMIFCQFAIDIPTRINILFFRNLMKQPRIR